MIFLPFFIYQMFVCVHLPFCCVLFIESFISIKLYIESIESMVVGKSELWYIYMIYIHIYIYLKSTSFLTHIDTKCLKDLDIFHSEWS